MRRDWRDMINGNGIKSCGCFGILLGYFRVMHGRFGYEI